MTDMPYVVTEACIGVKGEGCMEVCPEFCIYSEPDDVMSFIDPANCTSCGVCMEACVVGAIFPASKIPKASIEFINLNERWFHSKTGVRERLKIIVSESDHFTNAPNSPAKS